MHNRFPTWGEFMMQPIAPELYVNHKSFEQFIIDISCEYNKLVNYVKAMTSTVNEQYSIIENLQNQLPNLVNDDTTDYMNENLSDSSSILHGIVSDTVEDWADERTAQVDANTAAIAEFGNAANYGDIENNSVVIR